MILVLMFLLVVTVNLSSSSSSCAPSISVTSPLRDRVVFQNESFNFTCSFTGELHGVVRLIISGEMIIDETYPDVKTVDNVHYERTSSGFNVSIDATTVLENNNTKFKCETSNGDYCSTEGILYVVTGI